MEEIEQVSEKELIEFQLQSWGLGQYAAAFVGKCSVLRGYGFALLQCSLVMYVYHYYNEIKEFR